MMELKVNLGLLGKEVDASTWKSQQKIQNSMKRLGIETSVYAKEIIDTFINASGHSQGVDSGLFRDGVHSTVIDGGYGFKVNDSVPYGIYHEFGTEEHFVPFVDEAGSLTNLGKWAVRHFTDIGFEAIGTSGKKLKRPSRKTREEIIIDRGGMIVSLDEMAPFRKALDYAHTISPTVFREEFGR